MDVAGLERIINWNLTPIRVQQFPAGIAQWLEALQAELGQHGAQALRGAAPSSGRYGARGSVRSSCCAPSRPVRSRSPGSHWPPDTGSAARWSAGFPVSRVCRGWRHSSASGVRDSARRLGLAQASRHLRLAARHEHHEARLLAQAECDGVVGRGIAGVQRRHHIDSAPAAPPHRPHRPRSGSGTTCARSPAARRARATSPPARAASRRRRCVRCRVP